jgi:hypothetical protein
MRDATPFRERQLRGSDIHPLIELHGVGVDDFGGQAAGTELFRDFQR